MPGGQPFRPIATKKVSVSGQSKSCRVVEFSPFNGGDDSTVAHSGPWSDKARAWEGSERPERGGPCCMSETEVNGDTIEYK
jgi:hypothetical protein